MNRRMILTGSAFLLWAMVPLAGCLSMAEQQAAALYAEIQALAADRSSTSDSQCGVATLRGCLGPDSALVYSRATVNEEVLLEKVRQYNELVDLDPFCDPIPGTEVTSAISESGVCVVGSR